MVPLSTVRSRPAPARCALFLLALIVGLAGSACASARPISSPAAAATASATAANLSGYARQALYQQIHGACRLSMRPDRAVIVGGMSAAGIKPTDTAARLDRQLDALRTLVDEENATLRLLERVRAAWSSEPRGGLDEPYVVMQRIEVETDLGADLDRLLERTLQVGLDRYGSQAGVDRASGSRLLVVYRFSELEQRLQDAHDRCREDAVLAWCGSRAGGDAGACVEELSGPGVFLVTDRFVLSSQPVTKANGAVDSVQVTWPLMATAPIELGGDVELQLFGSITLRGVEGFR